MKYVCTVCGYVYEGDAAPAECPICHAPASKFTKQEEGKTWAAEHVVGVAKGAPEDIIADLRANFQGECSEVGRGFHYEYGDDCRGRGHSCYCERDSKCGKWTASYDHKVRQSRTRDREWNIDVYIPDTESGEYGSRCSYRCRDHRYL